MRLTERTKEDLFAAGACLRLNPGMRWLVHLLGCVLLVMMLRPGGATELGIEGTKFTIDGKRTFLLGVSYYGALSADESFWKQDLDEMQRLGFNWVRVWATWAAHGNDVSAVDTTGAGRPEFLERLAKFVGELDRRGMVVDVTLSRGNRATGPARLQTFEHHQRAVATLVNELKPYRNWYLDLGNERSIRDKRFVSHEELKRLRDLAREMDPKRVVTASHSSSDTSFLAEFSDYTKVSGIDFLAPHRPRHKNSAFETEEMTRRYLAKLRELGERMPIHYQEPFRRGFSEWEPKAGDFIADLRGALKGGAAGWCFHNGSEKGDAELGRSFDMRKRRLFEQLDEEEKEAVGKMKEIVGELFKE